MAKTIGLIIKEKENKAGNKNKKDETPVTKEKENKAGSTTAPEGADLDGQVQE